MDECFHISWMNYIQPKGCKEVEISWKVLMKYLKNRLKGVM